MTAVLILSCLTATASPDAAGPYQMTVVRTVRMPPLGAVRNPSVYRFTSRLQVDGSRFREDLTSQILNGDRVENEQRHTVASDGARRVSLSHRVDKAGKQRVVIGRAAPRSLADWPWDPLALTASTPLLTAAPDEDTLAGRAAEVAADLAAAGDAERLFVLPSRKADGRTWRLVVGPGRRIPRVCEERLGDTVLVRVSVVDFAIGPAAPNTTARPVRLTRHAATAAGGIDGPPAVEAEVRDWATVDRLPAETFTLPIPSDAVVDDRLSKHAVKR